MPSKLLPTLNDNTIATNKLYLVCFIYIPSPFFIDSVFICQGFNKIGTSTSLFFSIFFFSVFLVAYFWAHAGCEWPKWAVGVYRVVGGVVITNNKPRSAWLHFI